MKYFLAVLVTAGLIGGGIIWWSGTAAKGNIPGISTPTPAPRQADISVPLNIYSAWIGYWDEEKALTSLNLAATQLRSISPMWYRLDKKGAIVWISDVTKKSEIVDAAVKNNIQVLPTLTNEFDPEKISSFLNDDAKMQQQIDFLVSEAVINGYKGWDIDFEEMYPGDSSGFLDFVNRLAEELHNKKLLLSVTVQAKTNTKGNREATQAQNWPELAKNADFIRVMIYDFHNDSSGPGAITPLSDLDQVLKYAITVVSREKLVVGLPLFGYDWSGNKGVPVQYDEAVNIANDNKTTFTRDNSSQELTANFWKNGRKHEMWIVDKTANQVKLNIGRSYGVYQYIYWRIGGEDPKTWE